MSTQPDWHDAPTCAGIWLYDFGDCLKSEWAVTAVTDWNLKGKNFDRIYRDGSRYYGPIPEDKPKAPDAT